MEKLKAVILAAGEGTRMKSSKPKVLHELFGRPMVSYAADCARKAGAADVCMVVGHKADEVKKALESEEVSFAEQTSRLGTGHAVMQAGDFIEADSDILILYGDTPLVRHETIERLIEFHRTGGYAASVISAKVANPYGYGRIIRGGGGEFLKSVEQKDANEAERAVNEINTGIYCFKGSALLSALKRIKNDNAQGEYYLPDTLQILLADKAGVNAMVAEDASEFFGVNSRVQLAEAADIMKRRINTFHMENGVTIVDINNTYIAPDVEIAMDTTILPGCVIEGGTRIGSNCMIGPNSRLVSMKLADNVTFQSSTGYNSSVGEGTSVGPFAYIRPNCAIGGHVKVGDFVEVKNSTIGDGTKISHLTYIGDTDLGNNINIGCGTVTVNYDGKRKFRTVVEDGAFIGCNANLVAPVTVKKGAYVAAGSTITKDVEEKALAVARARQQEIEGWVEKHNSK